MNKNTLISKLQDKKENMINENKNTYNKDNKDNDLSITNNKEINIDTLIQFLFSEISERHLSFDSQSFNDNTP